MRKMKYIIRAVRSRQKFVEEILKQIPEAVVYYDEFGNAREAFVHVCDKLIKDDEPCVMLEDDIILCDNFKNKIEKVIAEQPDMLINFFSLSKKFIEPHYKKGREFCMTQCVYFPVGLNRRIVEVYPEWLEVTHHQYLSAVDYLTGYAWGNNRNYFVYCPSLVQHIEGKSMINPKRSSKRQSITFKKGE